MKQRIDDLRLLAMGIIRQQSTPRSQAGTSLALLAVFFAVVFLPLGALMIDIPLTFLLRAQTQAATDAGSVGLATSLDVPAFRDNGEVKLGDAGVAYGAFNQTVPGGTFSGSIDAYSSGAAFDCGGAASRLPLMPYPLPLFTRAQARSLARFTAGP